MKNKQCWCGCEDFRKYEYFRKGIVKDYSRKIKIVKCLNCGTVRMFDNGLLGEPHYNDSYIYGNVSPRHKKVVSLVNTYSSGESLIDVGCNTGVLLNAIKDNVLKLKRFKGIDIDSKAIEIGREKTNLDLEAKYIEDETGKFDNVVLCHVLEHVPDFKSFFNKVDDILSDNGKIYISVPNVDSVGARQSLRLWNGLSPDFHLWYFNINTLKECINKFLPNNRIVHQSSFFIWKPPLYPRFIWNYIVKNNYDSLIEESGDKFKGDQIDLVIEKIV